MIKLGQILGPRARIRNENASPYNTPRAHSRNDKRGWGGLRAPVLDDDDCDEKQCENPRVACTRTQISRNPSRGLGLNTRAGARGYY